MKFGTALLASFFLTATFLSGCQQSSNLPQIGKATQELPKKLQDKMAAKNMEKYSPIVVRVFKEESVVEIWKQTRTGKYDLISTYNICKWSGKLELLSRFQYRLSQCLRSGQRAHRTTSDGAWGLFLIRLLFDERRKHCTDLRFRA